MRAALASGRILQRTIVPLARIAVWAFASITVLLSAWVGLGWAIGGWTPVVITSGSMEPTVGVGDVLLVDDPGAVTVGQRSIVVFDRDGDTIAHRVFAIEGGEYVTKGDANPTPDTQRLDPARVTGVGRLVVPLVGLPVVWWEHGTWWALLGWGALLAATAARMAMTAERFVFRGRGADEADGTSGVSDRHRVGRHGVQRVRILIAILVVAQYAIGTDRVSGSDGTSSVLLMIGTVTVLLGTNAFGAWAERDRGHARLLALAELAVDTALVVVLAMSTGTSGFTWVLFSLPIIEAAVRFRLVGALVHWMLLTVITLAAKVWQGAHDPSSIVLEDLEQLVDQLSVLFLVVVPAAYLAEQLLGEVTTWQDATGQAEDRSQLLVRVADIGRDIVRLDGQNVDAMLAGVRSLGFERADILVEEANGSWRVVAGDVLPAPGGPASCVRRDDLQHGSGFIDGDDPDPDDVAALGAHRLGALIAHVVSEHERRRVVLRAALEEGSTLSGDLVEAFRLLAGQATVALRNEQLLAAITTMHQEMEHQALHDALTGLPNRALLLQRLSTLAAGGARPALFFLDLDGFKPVNDRLGHDIGDLLLQQVARRLRSATPEGATVARLGGDEFTVLLGDCHDPAWALTVAQRISDSIRAPYDVERDIVVISTSIGIAFGGPGVAEAELLRRADVAMYEAKHGGRTEDGIEVYRDEFDVDAHRRSVLIAGFERAMVRGEVTLAFQPIFELGADTRLVGAEALVRWHHDVYGAIPPPDIIETARSADLLGALNRHIIRTACEMAAEWRRADPGSRCFVTVNASPEELAGDGLVGHVADALASTGLPVDLLYVEISERLVSPASERVLANVAGLRSLGVGLLLDDFGQGSTSLSYLHELPLAGIKLDRRLVVNALRSVTDEMVLQAVVQLSRRLGLLVIAEGIETAEHLGAVAEVGCTMAQGFHLGRPQPPEAIVDLLHGGAARRAAPAALPAPVAEGLVAPTRGVQ